MNYKKEPYPKNLKELIKISDEVGQKVTLALCHKDCATLRELYDQRDKKNYIKNNIFERMNCPPNTKRTLKCKSHNEIKGIYVFGELERTSGKVIPIYVGISRTVCKRLRNHGWGKLHNQATLAYLISAHKKKHKGRRIELDKNIFIKAQRLIQKYKVVIIPVEHDYDLHFMEAYLSGRLRTKWNSFKTH